MPPIKQVHFEERRASVRADRVVTVHHRLFKRGNHKVNSKWQMASSENMSLTGLLFVGSLAYQPDDILELEVVMAGILDIFNGYGKVVRSILNKNGHYAIAVKYVDLKIKRRAAKSLIVSRH
jgi:hypothetical protein